MTALHAIPGNQILAKGTRPFSRPVSRRRLAWITLRKIGGSLLAPPLLDKSYNLSLFGLTGIRGKNQLGCGSGSAEVEQID